ncbi:hypothetical protein DFJ58DRAFT_850696, partial [Suillus subalutaceus]|uniref:uncharacterized protein n=1 Tax=Suillus subalutaceus TaxID=48586 RepID=UPI001B85C8F5
MYHPGWINLMMSGIKTPMRSFGTCWQTQIMQQRWTTGPTDFMSGDWAWNQADIISKDLDATGSTFVPVMLGSDKTTVSVATGAHDYYPLYVSIRNVHNNIRSTKEHTSCPQYRKYHRQLFHSSISKILENLRPGMTKPEVVRFGNGHYQHVIYGLGPYIADYEEQCPRCMSHHKNLDAKSLHRNRDHTEALIEEVSSTDLWDEYGIIRELILIKGTFKDHLVEWVGKYLLHMHRKKGAEKIQDEIDQRITVVASFSESMLVQIQEALDRFHYYRKVFESIGVIPTFSLPQQHSCSHYILLIRLFGAPNGLCSSITETKHIKAVKEPWRHLSCYKALGQMLVANQCLDKLAASNTSGTKVFPDQPNENNIILLPDLDITIQGDNEEGDIIDGLTLVQAHVQLAKTLLNPDDQRSPSEVPLASCPQFDGKIHVFNSASSTFYAPSDHSGIGGMHWEYIHACPVWRNEAPQYD